MMSPKHFIVFLLAVGYTFLVVKTVKMIVQNDSSRIKKLLLVYLTLIVPPLGYLLVKYDR